MESPWPAFRWLLYKRNDQINLGRGNQNNSNRDPKKDIWATSGKRIYLLKDFNSGDKLEDM
jgi:hypothetical protein